MKNVLAALAVLVIVLNAYVGYSELSGTGSSLFKKAKEDGGEVVDLKEVIVPAVKLHDDVLYDYKLVAELYSKNTNESDQNYGQWEDYRLDIDGTSRHSYRTTTEAIDGYSNVHKVLTHEQKTIAGFNIIVKSSDAEDLMIPGNMNVGNTEYTDLTERNNIQNDITAAVDITRLPKVNQPVSFSGYLRDWTDPKVAAEKTFEDEIAGDLKPVKIEDKGTVVRETFLEQWNYLLRTEYNWTVEGAEMISGYPSMRINITTNLFGEASMPFNETLWMSSEVPLPTKKFTRTYTNWSDDENEGFMLLETTYTIHLKKESGYTPGDMEVPWGQCGGKHWDTQHVVGEYKSWDMIPQAGAGYVDSSFLYKPEDAADFAEKNNAPLKKWMSRYNKDRTFIEWADYNATPKVPGEKPGSYEWQLYYSYYPTMDEIERAHEADQMNFSFSIHVIKNITKSGIIGDQYNETVEIDYYNDTMHSYGASMNPQDLSSNMLTLASSEDILLSQPEVRDNVTSQLSRGRIDWSKSIVYNWGTPALGGSNPGMQMVTTLTGMEFPTTKTAWTLQKGTVWESGDTYMATVDAETGRLVMVTHIQGTALLGLFGD